VKSKWAIGFLCVGFAAGGSVAMAQKAQKAVVRPVAKAVGSPLVKPGAPSRCDQALATVNQRLVSIVAKQAALQQELNQVLVLIGGVPSAATGDLSGVPTSQR